MEPKKVIIVVAERDCCTGNGGTDIHVKACDDRKSAAEWLESSYNTEAEWHGWPTTGVCAADIEDGYELVSPESDPDHDYKWKVQFIY